MPGVGDEAALLLLGGGQASSISLKLCVSRASSSDPSTGIGRSSPVAATRSAAAVSRSTGRNPARATATPASAATSTPIPPTIGNAMPSLASTCRVGSSRCAITSACPGPAWTATTR